MVPLHAAAIAILIRVAGLGRDYDPWLRLTAVATLAQHGVALAYPPYARYYFLTWLLTLLVVLVWARRDGLRLLRRYSPGVAARLFVAPGTDSQVVIPDAPKGTIRDP